MSLIEILLVLMIIAILAMIVIPRFTTAGLRVRETALRTTLDEMRSSVEICRGQTGGHPSDLHALLKPQAPGNVRVLPDGHPMHCIKEDWHGPYLSTPSGKLPEDPVTGKRNWDYDDKTGEVHSRSKDQALDGTFYCDW